MSSIADVCNEALSHIGVGEEIADLDTETTPEANACRRFFVGARDVVLRDFAWPFAGRLATLGLVTDFSTDDTAEWAYAYRYPAGALTIRRLLSGTRTDSNDTKTPYRILSDATGKLIYTDLEDAEAEYTILVDEIGKWPQDALDALAYLLASKIAPRFGPVAVKLGDRAIRMYEWRMNVARANAANEEIAELPPDSDFITARG